MHRAARRTSGAFTVEFVLILMGSLGLFAMAGEFLRLSLIDQTLARATHQAARAAGADPLNCNAAIRAAFEADGAARWLLDLDADGSIGIAPGAGWPDNSSTAEVRVEVASDADLADGVSWDGSGCGVEGSWIQVSSRIVVRPWFGPLRPMVPDGGFRRLHRSWARNQG